MMKMMDKTNIDFIGPRHYCMAGLGDRHRPGPGRAFCQRPAGTMYNIDFTGGTLVTIRLERARPRGQGALRVGPRRPSSARQAERPARRDGREPEGRRGPGRSIRFNIRTTDQNVEQVKDGDPEGVRARPSNGSR